MAKLHDIYTCKVCGQVIEVLHEGAGELVCCGQPMQHQAAGTTDGAAEKHVPVIEKIEGGYKVTVGSVAHPMLDVHWIEFIELICDTCGKVQRHYLKPGEAPQAIFKTEAEHVTAREYCNIHGLWEAKN